MLFTSALLIILRPARMHCEPVLFPFLVFCCCRSGVRCRRVVLLRDHGMHAEFMNEPSAGVSRIDKVHQSH